VHWLGAEKYSIIVIQTLILSKVCRIFDRLLHRNCRETWVIFLWRWRKLF